MTEVLRVDAGHPDMKAIARAGDCLRRGGLVAFPTETVYGLGVHALDRAAVQRLFAAKGRPATDPLIVHVATLADARRLASDLPATAERLAARFWPGPLTLVVRKIAAVPAEVTAGLDTVAIRVPAHPVARALVTAAGLPVAAPSANLFSKPSPTTAQHVLDDLDGRIDMVIDAGPTDVGVESTVLDLSGPCPTVLRPGVITLEMLREVLPDAVAGASTAATNQPQRAPGLLAKHYAPRTPLTLYRGAPGAIRTAIRAEAERLSGTGRTVILLALDEDRDGFAGLPLISIGSGTDLTSISRRLYAAFREADAVGADAILVGDVASPAGLGDALRDRLQRAAAEIKNL